MTQKVSNGVVHNVPPKLKTGLEADAKSLLSCEDSTPLARNEFICWIEDAKKPETRANCIKRTDTEIAEGKRRPCCWAGCPHRG